MTMLLKYWDKTFFYYIVSINVSTENIILRIKYMIHQGIKCVHTSPWYSSRDIPRRCKVCWRDHVSHSGGLWCLTGTSLKFYKTQSKDILRNITCASRDAPRNKSGRALYALEKYKF